jgi:hypothetical protein
MYTQATCSYLHAFVGSLVVRQLPGTNSLAAEDQGAVTGVQEDDNTVASGKRIKQGMGGRSAAKDAAAQLLKLLQAGRVGGRKSQKRTRPAAAEVIRGTKGLQPAREREISLDAVHQFEVQLAAYKQSRPATWIG